MKDTISEGASIAFLCFTGYDLSFIVFLWIIEFNFCTKKKVKLLLFCIILKYNYGQLTRQNYSVSYTGTQSKMERCLHPKEILILRSMFLRGGGGQLGINAECHLNKVAAAASWFYKGKFRWLKVPVVNMFKPDFS